MKATFEEGTDLILDSETLTVPVAAGWVDKGDSTVSRQGSIVTVVLNLEKKALAAWEKKKYEKGELATEGGKTYEAIVAETDENKPSTKPTEWTSLGVTPENTHLLFVLPAEYRPAVEIDDEPIERQFKTNGEVLAEEAGRSQHTFRAAEIVP